MITYATFARRFYASVITFFADLLVLALLSSLINGDNLWGVWVFWLAIHHIGLVGEGGAFGHRALGLRIVRTDGSRLGVIRAIFRWVVSLLSLASIGLGALWMLDQPQKKMWHDLAADSVVVRELSAKTEVAPEWAQVPPWRVVVDAGVDTEKDEG